MMHGVVMPPTISCIRKKGLKVNDSRKISAENTVQSPYQHSNQTVIHAATSYARYHVLTLENYEISSIVASKTVNTNLIGVLFWLKRSCQGEISYLHVWLLLKQHRPITVRQLLDFENNLECQ